MQLKENDNIFLKSIILVFNKMLAFKELTC